ncbi:MAG: GIY-YIG nuclease family protein [Bacteroidota bacterium]
MWNVYLLRCVNGTYYTGCTNLNDRIEKYLKSGSGKAFTFKRLI